ncbi:PPE domain-containing protein [Saccharothrix hoggarensis]|uniref:PPE domain-containing protein n=1 Tax=Saccharothrix hoggarensis TaxID=913853 RepID=A0ABW3QTW7_9PSEU
MGDHRWRGYTHPDLHRMINEGPGVAASRPLEDSWKALSETLTDIDASIQDGLAKLGASWEGETADQTTTALSPLAAWAADAQQGSSTMETSAQLQGEYIVDARKEMPEPVPVTTEAPSTGDKVLGALGGPFGMMHVIQQQQDHERQEAAQDNAEAKAVEVMNNYQSSSEWNADTLGTFVPPPKVVIDTPPPAGAGEYNNTTVNPTTTPTWTPPPSESGTTKTSWAPPPTGTPVAPPPTFTGPTGTTGTTHTSWVQPPTGTPTPVPPPVNPPVNTPVKPPVIGTPPMWTPPKPPTTTTSVPPRGPSVPTGPGRPGVPTGRVPGMPGALTGKPGISATIGAIDPDERVAGRGAAGAAGVKAGAGASMLQPAASAKGGPGEEDGEHVRKYGVDSDDVFGDERMVVQSVIGDEPEKK